MSNLGINNLCRKCLNPRLKKHFVRTNSRLKLTTSKKEGIDFELIADKFIRRYQHTRSASFRFFTFSFEYWNPAGPAWLGWILKYFFFSASMSISIGRFNDTGEISHQNKSQESPWSYLWLSTTSSLLGLRFSGRWREAITLRLAFRWGSSNLPSPNNILTCACIHAARHGRLTWLSSVLVNRVYAPYKLDP